MTSSSDERAPQPEPAPGVFPFEQPSELQRAVQQRAQERLEAESIKPKVPVVRRLVTFAVALIPVAFIVFGYFVTVHAVRVITSITTKATASPPPVAVEAQQPGVVILVPDKEIAQDAQQATAPAAAEEKQ